MELIRKVANFGPSREDLKNLYVLFVRSQLEQSAVVWHSSLTEENVNSLERVQKSAIKIIMGEKYQSYKKSLNFLNLDTLKERREKLCIRFAKNALKNEKACKMFPMNEKKHIMITKKPEMFKVQKANTERLKNSAIIYMQNLLNKENLDKY